jgi:hypothetical protein
VSLVLLIVLPFTAPFSSCPLSSLIGADAAPASQTPSTSSAQHNPPTSGALSVLMEEDMKDDATLPVRWELGVVAVRGQYQTLVFRGVSVTPFLPIVLRV